MEGYQFDILLMLYHSSLKLISSLLSYLKAVMNIMEVCFTECIDGLKLPNDHKYSSKGNRLGGLFHLTIRPGSLNIYMWSYSFELYQRMRGSISFEHRMFFEWARFESFRNAPETFPMWTVKLAKYGFYYTGFGHNCQCAFCGLVYGDWRYNDDPEEVHRRHSPNCPLVHDRMNINNIPIMATEVLQGQSAAISLGRNRHYMAVCHDGHASRYQNMPGFLTMATQTQFSEGTAATRSVPVSSPATVTQSLVGTQKLTSVTTQSQSTANTTTSSQSQTPPEITNTTSASNSAGGSSRTGASGSSSTGTSGSSNKTVGSQPTRTKFDPLGINFAEPRYPPYAVLTGRIKTYNGWPAYLDQTPRVMAMAGFFYAGYEDYTRCFFCGGGLRNWEAGDDPWVEHARWFPKCAFLRQNRGDTFVARVQARHHEVESANQPILSPQLSVLELLDDERPANSMSSVAVQALREIGKDDSIINEAIDRWKANRRQAGQPIASVEMQATKLYEIILQIENERTQRVSAQSSTQQLSLPTNQAPTQTTGDTNEQPAVAEGTSQELPAYLEGFDLVLEEYEEQKERLTCRICTENPVAVAFLPCVHLVYCLDCAPAMRNCPICHRLVEGTIKIFFS